MLQHYHYRKKSYRGVDDGDGELFHNHVDDEASRIVFNILQVSRGGILYESVSRMIVVELFHDGV